MKKKVCWKITTKCNQGCKYCFGFNNIPNLSFEENREVLDHLIKSGINHITWTGGEAVLYPRVNELMKESKEKGLYNKLVTNGIFLSKNDNEYVDDILNTLDEINISIDSIENNINVALGKENNHLEIIKNLLEKTKNKNIKIGINTVVSKLNVNKLDELGEFLNNYNIEKWKFLKFMNIRERAEQNAEQFEVEESKLEENIRSLKDFKNIKKIEYKKQSEFERSIVILPNADVIQTRNGKDHYFGNVLEKNIIDFDKIHSTERIRTLIAHDDEKIRNNLIELLKRLDYVDVIGVATDGNDAYNKIVNLKPEMVFAQYDMHDINGLEVAIKTKKNTNIEIPIFNIFNDKNDISESELEKTINIIGNKLNALIQEPYENRVQDIIKDYKEFKYKN
ncbi:MAG TPA: radical SAM protein [Clostridiaceae bacterium]|nr:radical SAM protein [Clostridiaceae bacterium]